MSTRVERNTEIAIGDQYKLDDLRESALRFVARNFRRIRTEAKPTLLPLQENLALMMEVMLDAI